MSENRCTLGRIWRVAPVFFWHRRVSWFLIHRRSFIDAAMKLQFPFIQLPLAFDAQLIASEVAALGEASWRPHPQGFPGNSMLPLVAVDGDPANESFAGAMRPTPALQRCPYLMQVFASLGATVGRSRLMRLAGQAEVARHADQGYYWTERVRVHVPIVTQATVRFECGDAAINMAAGECWIFDTWRQHRVLNDAVESRIHLVVDTVGGGRFWELVAKGRHQNSPANAANWQAHRVVPGENLPSPAFETNNVPEVMSPWELATHLAFLFNEAIPHPQLPLLQQYALQLMREWRGLWAEHGPAEEGRPKFRALFDSFATAARTPAQTVMLRNNTRWYEVLTVMLGHTVVRGTSAGGLADAAAQRVMGDNA
jgi:hypothetical protein